MSVIVERLYPPASATTLESLQADLDRRMSALLTELMAEMTRGFSKHGSYQAKGLHHAASVLREEYEEFWDLVKTQKPEPEDLRKELLQVAAVALRTIHELNLN